MNDDYDNTNTDRQIIERLRVVAAKQVEKARAEYARYATNDIAAVADNFWEQVKPTARSDDRPARPSKPADGRAAYVWRMLRFHLGEDVHMPVMADWDMHADIDRESGYDYLNATDEQRSAQRARRDSERKRLDAVVEYILATRFPARQFRGAAAWKGLLY